MGKLTGMTAVMRGAATIVMLAVPNSNTSAYPGKVTARAQDAQGTASTGT
jgi:hypothetical protein